LDINNFLFIAFPHSSPCVISIYKQSKVICIIYIFSWLMKLLKHAELGLCTIYSSCALQFKFLSVCRLGNVVLHINAVCLLGPVFSFTCVSFTSKFFQVKMLIKLNIWNLFLSMSYITRPLTWLGKDAVICSLCIQ
jgi:hypothetical protein